MHFTQCLFLSLTALSGASAQTLYLIRHGEKPPSGNGLNAQGMQRAQCLRNVFGASSQYNVQYIMAEKPKSDGSRERPLDTVTPLAQDLGITVDTSCGRDDYNCAANVVDNYSGPGSILLCWEHKALTNIVQALGDNSPPTYPDSSSNLIWTDPYPYSSISSITSENCPGLDS